MSQENVEIMRQAFEQWLRGGATADAVPPAYLSGWTGYHAEVMEFVDAGENVVVILHETARIGDSGVPVERDLVQVWTLRDGVAVRYRTFKTIGDAREAVGLSE